MRSIIYIDNVKLPEEHDYERPLTDGWEIHVRTDEESVDLFFAVKSGDGWLLKHFQGDTCRCNNLGDVFMQALDPISPEDHSVRKMIRGH
jgi:hypothetical protein